MATSSSPPAKPQGAPGSHADRRRRATMGRLAAIDIGSNSVRLVVAEPVHGDQFRIIDEERQCTRLARSLGSTGELDTEAIETTLQTLRNFKHVAEGLQVSHLETIATCAVREASNSELFLQRVAEEVGLRVQVISALQEGLFALRSVQAAFDIADQNVAVVDIGGGSTEIVMVSSGHVEQVYSTNLGAVRMTELYGGSRILFDHESEQLLSCIDRDIKQQIGHPPFTPQVMYGTGGTFTTLASMMIARRREDLHAVWGYRVTRADVRHLLERVRRMSPKERRNVPGLGADRADIIVAGLAIVDRVMARLRTNTLRVHSGGVREGLLLSMLDHAGAGQAFDEPHPDEAIERFATSCGVDPIHANHVAHLAGRLFDELRAWFPLDDSSRRLLVAAARLQDVGYLINYKSHHKHSLQLIYNSQLPGFRKQELAMIANIARYHRGGFPKKKHDHFRQLPKPERTLVRQLAAILRIAGGLDRGYAQRVTEVKLVRAGERLTLHLVAASDPELELWSVRDRSALFERVFDCKLVVVAEACPTGGKPPDGPRRPAS